MFEIGRLTRLAMGYVSESNSRPIEICVADWLADWPGATIGLLLMRPGEDTYYPADSKVVDGVLHFTPSRADMAIPGDGLAQIVMTDENDVELRSRVVRTMIECSLPGSEAEAPEEPMRPFVDQVLEAAASAVESADLAGKAAGNAAADAGRAEAAADNAEAAAKRAEEAASMIGPGGGGTGTVTSVNGVQPDEAGNVEIDIPEPPKKLSALEGDAEHRLVTDTEKAAWDAKSSFSGKYADLSGKPTIPTKLSELAADASHRLVTDTEKSAWNAKSTFSGKYADLTGKPTKVSAFENDAGYLTEHQDISHLLPRTELGAAVDVALAEAKESGAFDGEDGKDGKTPVAGVDYYTPEDKAEFSEYIATELAKRDQIMPEFASSEDECTDPGKLYVLPDGYIYAIMSREVTTEGGTIANYTNMLKHSDAEIKSGYRYSHSSSAFKVLSGCMSVIIPIPTSGEITLRFRNCRYYSDSTGGTAYPQVYGGTSKTAFPTQYITAATGWKTDGNGDNYVTFSNTTGNTYITVGLNTFDQNSAVITINEEITETTIPGGTEIVTELVNTGLAFVPADYEPRIIKAEEDIADLDSRVKTLENTSNASALSMMVYAPSPQLPADGSVTADFDAANISADAIYVYIDALVAKHPRYLTKETLGKDESGTYDWNRYTASRRTYDAWVKPAYPAMYAWLNGSTVIYSVSVSPRVGDTMYSTAHIGTAYSTVTAVDNANQTRKVNGLVFSRDKTKDIAPTLVYTLTDYDSRRLGVYASWHNTVYNASRGSIGTIASIADGVLTDSNNNTYNRYPMGDVDSNFTKLPVLVIGSNEHGGNISGDPAEAAIITARLIKDLCECRNADNPFLNMLKSEYMIVFCPVINPWGYGQENGYVNANGVNLDRNMDTPGWGSDADTRHGDYGGSENEAQYLMNTLYASGAKIALANHALGSHVNTGTGEAVSAGMCSYMLGRDNSKYNGHLAAIAETMAVDYDLSMFNMGQAPGDTYAKTRSYMDYIGVEGGAVEMTAIEGYLLHGGARHTAQVMEADYTLLLQFLQMLIVCKEG